MNGTDEELERLSERMEQEYRRYPRDLSGDTEEGA